MPCARATRSNIAPGASVSRRRFYSRTAVQLAESATTACLELSAPPRDHPRPDPKVPVLLDVHEAETIRLRRENWRAKGRRQASS
jgi:hypothetical protein